MSIRSGLRVGVRTGLRVGSNVGYYTFTRDGPNNVIIPLTSADWTVGLGKPAPLYQWACQEPSGSLASSIGSLALAPTGANVVYQQSITNWAMKFVGFSSEASGSRFSTTDASLDAAAGESVAWFFLASAQLASASPRAIIQASQAGVNNFHSRTTLYGHSHNNSLGTNSAVNVPSLSTVIAGIWFRNATTNVSGLILPGETLAATHDESAYTANTTKGIGANGLSCAICRVGKLATWKGADAELIAVPGTIAAMGW